MSNHTTFLNYINETYWAMDELKLRQICDVFERHVNGIKLSDQEIDSITASSRSAGKKEKEYEVVNGKAVIPVSGVIAKYSNLVNGYSQPRGVSLEKLSSQLHTALNDRLVNSIMLVIESPGGSVRGLADFADELYQASFEKPVEAFADDLAASAAYYIGSQAQRIYANQSASVGSIGVYTLVADTTKLYENIGYKIHIVRSGSNKGVGASGVPITKENLKVIGEEINGHFEMFLNAIMRSRKENGLEEKSLRELADGRTYLAEQAVKNKLIDGVMTLNQALLTESPEPRIRNSAAVVAAEKIEENKIKKKEQNMSEETKKDAAAKEEIQNAMAADRKRVASILETFPGDAYTDLRKEAIEGGYSLEQTKAKAYDIAQAAHAKQIAEKDSQLKDAQSRLDAIAKGGDSTVTSPPNNQADQAESGSQAAGDDGKAETITKYVEEQKAKGVAGSKAYSIAARRFPNSYRAWKESQLKSGERE